MTSRHSDATAAQSSQGVRENLNLFSSKRTKTIMTSKPSQYHSEYNSCTPPAYNRIQSHEKVSNETGKKILYPINVGRPSGDYVAHIMFNNRAEIQLKQTSKFRACPVCYLPVMTIPIAETME